MLLKTIKIRNLFKALNLDNDEYYKVQKSNENILIESPNGFVPIRGYVIKNNINCVDANINGIHIKGADKHLVKVNNKWQTLDSFEHKDIGIHNCYDIAVDNPHEYLTSNGIINHNTSVAKALLNDMGAEFLYINASKENGIEMVRKTIDNFSSTMGFNLDQKQKIVLLDEADGLSLDAQESLRAFIEENEENCRFIFTANNKRKMLPALLDGRTMTFNFDMNRKEWKEDLISQMVKRIVGICKVEKIEITDPEIINKYVADNYPGLRKMIANIQKYAWMYGQIDEGILDFKDISEELCNLILNKKLTEARRYIEENGIAYSDAFHYLGEEVCPKLKNKGEATMIVANWEFQSNLSSDPSIQFAACLIDLLRVL